MSMAHDKPPGGPMRSWTSSVFSEKIGVLTSTPERESLTNEILRQLLALETPEITPELAQFLTLDRSVSCLLNFIVRAPISEPLPLNTIVRSPFSVAEIVRKRPSPRTPLSHAATSSSTDMPFITVAAPSASPPSPSPSPSSSPSTSSCLAPQRTLAPVSSSPSSLAAPSFSGRSRSNSSAPEVSMPLLSPSPPDRGPTASADAPAFPSFSPPHGLTLKVPSSSAPTDMGGSDFSSVPLAPRSPRTLAGYVPRGALLGAHHETREEGAAGPRLVVSLPDERMEAAPLRVVLNHRDLLPGDPQRLKPHFIRQSIFVDHEDFEELRLSYEATRLFMRQPLSDVIKKDPIGIIRRTWSIFHSSSKGNFWHWKSLVERALAADWGKVCRFLLGPSCLSALIDHLMEPSIQDILLHNLLNGRDINSMKPDDRMAFFSTLSVANFLPRLCERIYSVRSPPELITHASVFFRRLLEDLAPCRDADRFFIKLGESSELLMGLMDGALDDTRHPLQLTECALCLESLFEVSQRRLYTTNDFGDPSDAPTLQDNILQRIRGVFFRALRGHIRPLTVRITRMARSPGPDGKILNSYAISLINILSEMIIFDHRSFLSQLPPSIWTVLCDLCLSFPFHNIFHKTFVRMTCHVIRLGHAASLEQFMSPTAGLLARFIAHYLSLSPSGFRGHILIITNTLRLVAASESPTSLLASRLRDDAQWQAFLPVLIRDTLSLVSPLIPVPPGSLKTLQWTTFAIQDDSHPTIKDQAPYPDPACIDLGSPYASQLGCGKLRKFEAELALNVPVGSRHSFSPSLRATRRGIQFTLSSELKSSF